jgi:hypothetical protein
MPAKAQAQRSMKKIPFNKNKMLKHFFIHKHRICQAKMNSSALSNPGGKITKL